MFEWKENYSVEVDIIDEQHKKLLEIGAQLYDIVSNKANIDFYDEILNILESLKDYTVYHFEYEEKLMKEYNYEDLDKHKVEHRKFIQKIMSITEDSIDEKQGNVTMDMILFVADWIENHILKSDKKYSGIIASNAN